MTTAIEPRERSRKLPRRRSPMLRTILQRLGRAVVVVLIVTFFVTALLRMAPGSVAHVILGDGATQDQVDALNTELGLDQPLIIQYLTWLGNAVRGDLGFSPLTGQSVSEAIVDRLPVTLQLAGMGLGIALIVAILLAIVAASRPNSGTDRTISAFTMVCLSIPAFVAGPILIYFFAIQLGVLPALGWRHFDVDPMANLRHAVLPAIAIALTEIAALQRLLRSDLIDTLGEDYIAAARTKGLSGSYVMLRHALRPSSFSMITVAGISLGRLIGGTVVVEILFGLPGLGQLVALSITSRDVVMVQGIVVFIAVVYVGVNTLVDIGYGFLDPRVRRAGK